MLMTNVSLLNIQLWMVKNPRLFTRQSLMLIQHPRK